MPMPDTYAIPAPDPAASRPNPDEVPDPPESAAALRALTEWAHRAAWPLGPWPRHPMRLVLTEDMALWPYRWSGGEYPPVPGPPDAMLTADDRRAAAADEASRRFWYPITLLGAAREVGALERRSLLWAGERDFVAADPVAAGNLFGANIDSPALWYWGWGRNVLPDAVGHVARRDAERAITDHEAGALETAQAIYDWMVWEWPDEPETLNPPAMERPSPDYRR